MGRISIDDNAQQIIDRHSQVYRISKKSAASALIQWGMESFQRDITFGASDALDEDQFWIEDHQYAVNAWISKKGNVLPNMTRCVAHIEGRFDDVTFHVSVLSVAAEQGQLDQFNKLSLLIERALRTTEIA